MARKIRIRDDEDLEKLVDVIASEQAEKFGLDLEFTKKRVRSDLLFIKDLQENGLF